MEYLKIAEEFGEKIWPYKNKCNIEDIMLFGSVAYGKKNPTDLDILFLHYSEKLESFQDIAETKTNDLGKLTKLAELFNREMNILKIIQETSIMQLVYLNKFNTKFMDISFFTNQEYKNKWKEKNLKIYGHKKSKARLNGETFEECIFRQGLLYNQETQKYDIPALQKYNPKN
ncbi:MAG: hypothetical protein AABX44_00225 [Nanoarchaeota archaeon]